MKKIVTLEIEFGSDWQKQYGDGMVDMMIGALKMHLKNAHQKNKVKVTSVYTHEIVCPDCGKVQAIVEGWEDGRPVVGKCPKCKDTLYFA